MIAPLLASLLLAVDPCQDAPPLPQDPVAAQAYEEVARAHRSAGEDALAAIAYREVLRRAPDDAEARRALDAICHPAPSAYERGAALFQKGQLEGAIPLLEQARKEDGGASASLLEGIALFQLGREDEARPLLEQAASDASLRQSADFFLGLIALHRGDARSAQVQFAAASADPSLAESAKVLQEIAAGEGKVRLSLLAETLWDSNPTLLPTAARTSGASDLAFSLAGLLLAQPWGPSGPYARLSGAGSAELQYDVYDFAGGSGTVGWRIGPDGAFASGAYTVSYAALAGSPYLVSHQLLARGQLAPGRWLLGASYSAASRSFQTDLAAPYSGWLQRAHGYVGYRMGELAQLFGGYRLTRDGVTEADLSYLEHAPWAQVRFFIGQRVRLWAEADFALRTYDAVDGAVGLVREDRALEGTATGEVALTPRWSLRLSLSGVHQTSNVPDYSYDSGSISLGLQYTTGLF